MDAFYIVYTGTPLSYISVTPGMNLQTILQNINTAVNASSAAPNYSGYNLYCITQTDGTTHPTNTQNFAEGISKIVCDNKDEYDTFVGTTYVTDKSTFTSAINGLQVPALTYAAFSIVNTDTVTQVWNKSFTGFTAIINSIKPDAANWSSIGASTATSIVSAFNTLIAYELTQDGLITGKQASLGTFNTTAIGGSTGVAPIATINALIAYAAALPEFDAGDLNFDCVSTATDLQDTIQNIIDSVNYTIESAVYNNGTGLTMNNLGSCLGNELAIDEEWEGLYKVAVSEDDIADAGFLEDKFTSLDESIVIDSTTNPDKIDLSVALPVTGKVKVNSFDTTADYISVKIPSTLGNWGLSLVSAPSTDNSKLELSVVLSDPNLFANNLLDLISSNPDLVAKVCLINDQCSGSICTAPTDLLVELDGTDFVLTWVAQGANSQIAKYRNKGAIAWVTASNFDPANPLSSVDDTTTVSGLSANTVFEFQVDSICSTTTNSSDIFEAIRYACAVLTPSVLGFVISVTQDPFTTIDTIEYRLKQGAAVLQSGSTTGSSPNFTFDPVSAGTYKVEWRYGTSINGVTLYSNDASQLNAWCQSGDIIVS